jgi:outer membrane protein TolC
LQQSWLELKKVSARSIMRCTLLWLTIPGLAAQTNQTSPNSGSVPSGTASSEVLHLSLRDAIARALRYNLGQIESGENARIARGERLRTLSGLLPQANAGTSENVAQISSATLGIKIPQVPAVIGPFSYSTAQASANQTLFSFQSIQHFRAVRTAEQAALLAYNDTLNVITLIIGNAYLEVIQTGSRVTAAEAQVQNAQALYNQAVEQLQAGAQP